MKARSPWLMVANLYQNAPVFQEVFAPDSVSDSQPNRSKPEGLILISKYLIKSINLIRISHESHLVREQCPPIAKWIRWLPMNRRDPIARPALVKGLRLAAVTLTSKSIDDGGVTGQQRIGETSFESILISKKISARDALAKPGG